MLVSFLVVPLKKFLLIWAVTGEEITRDGINDPCTPLLSHLYTEVYVAGIES